MKVYFVRHGQSIFNKNKFQNKMHQFPDTPLAEAGIQQAQLASQRFSKIPVDIIYSSSYTRALQTAEIINLVVKKELVITDELVERKNPSLFPGKLQTDPDVIKVKALIKEHFNDKNWHYSDEENLYDFQKRISRFLTTLSNDHHENIVVVSHGYVLSMAILLMLVGDLFTPELYYSFTASTHSTNTGITMCEYKEGKWRLFTWNDYAHLG